MPAATSSVPGGRRSQARNRAELRARLQDRGAEIEAAIATRIHAIADPIEIGDPTYVESLRAALRAALEYGLAAIEHGEERAPPVPALLLSQAQMAARHGVGLDTVLRRYMAGYSLLGYFILEEGNRDGLMSGAQLQRLIGAQAGLFDRLLAAVGEEHARESERRLVSSKQRQAERIERLLAGELIDTAEIAYDFEGWHLGLVADGADAERSIRELAADLDCRPLLLRRQEGTVWAWLGTRRRLDPADLMHPTAERSIGQAAACGEPARGLSGWRLTHRQADAALSVARRGPDRLVRYADVALLASMLKDDLLRTSLHEIYLAPLQNERDGGAVLRETLRAYIAAERNVTSTAATLGVDRKTVTNRLRAVESVLLRPLGSALPDIEAALRLADCGSTPTEPTRRTR